MTTASSFEVRAAGRLSVCFILDIAAIGRVGERVLDALLVAAIINANTNWLLREPALQAAYATLDRPPPDEARRPISINALASSMGLPFETVRRHTRLLADQGYCVTTPRGLCVPTAVLASSAFAATTKARYDRLLQFYRELLAIEAIEPLPHELLPADDPRAPVLAVGRILSDFFFRTIDLLHAETRDPLTGMALLEITRSSSEHLSTARAEAAMRDGWISNELRMPVRVAHLARRLGAPYETMRRHVSWLIDRGFCERLDGGVVTSAAYLARPHLDEATVDNLANLRRMFRQLAALGDASGAESSVPGA